MDKIKIGTRSSKLAVFQAESLCMKIKKNNPDIRTEIIQIKTKGDVFNNIPVHEIGVKGVFAKEIEKFLIDGEIDIAVHSLKDVPVDLIEGLKIGAFLTRDDPRDAFISEKFEKLDDVPFGGRIGTGSFRRKSQINYFKRGLEIIDIRGNVETRIAKMQKEGLDGIILAVAGVTRLGLESKIRQPLPIDIFTPAPGQGVVIAEIRQDDDKINEMLTNINDKETEMCYKIEREFLNRTGAGCFLPVGAFCEKDENGFKLYGYIGDVEGKKVYKDTLNFKDFNIRYGIELAEKLLLAGGKEVIDDIRKKKNNNNKHS